MSHPGCQKKLGVCNQKLFPFLGTKQAAATAEKLAREKELAKVSIKNDIYLIKWTF